MENILQPDPSLSPKEKEVWIEARKKIDFAKTPPLKTVRQTGGGKSYGNLKREEESTPVRHPQKQWGN